MSREQALERSKEQQRRNKAENDMTTKHTPGPWRVLPAESDKDYLRVRGTQLGCRYKIANIHQVRIDGVSDSFRQHDDAESKANARLIAAAPEMLDALRIAREFMSVASDWNFHEAEINGEMRSTYDWLAVVDAAIAKATGETP